MKIKRDAIRNELEVRNGGGCIGAIGITFAMWMAVLGSGLIMGWRTGDFSTTGFVAGGVVIGKFILCGLGVGTYRERFHFDANRRALTLKRQVLFVTYLRREWSMHDFEAVELFWNCRDVNNTNHWFQEIRLLCAKDGAGAAERFTLGSGKAEKEMRGLAQEIADFCSLPLREPPKGAGW